MHTYTISYALAWLRSTCNYCFIIWWCQYVCDYVNRQAPGSWDDMFAKHDLFPPNLSKVGGPLHSPDSATIMSTVTLTLPFNVLHVRCKPSTYLSSLLLYVAGLAVLGQSSDMAIKPSQLYGCSCLSHRGWTSPEGQSGVCALFEGGMSNPVRSSVRMTPCGCSAHMWLGGHAFTLQQVRVMLRACGHYWLRRGVIPTVRTTPGR